MKPLAQQFPLTESCLGEAPGFEDTHDWVFELDNPYVHGAYAPIRQELPATRLEVKGELPADLFGTYVRNGPNPVHKPLNPYHPFDGDAMLHSISFREGTASYQNRYLETAALLTERDSGRSIWPGVMGPFDYSLPDYPIKDTANTDVCLFRGDLLATWYNAGNPYAIDPNSLATRGVYQPEGRSNKRMSAHAHVDPASGELLYMDFGERPPYLSYGVVGADGQLQHEIGIDLPGPRLPHDFGFTRNYTILHDLPLFHDPAILQRHKYRVLQFHRQLPSRFGIVPRYGQASELRWFECEPCYILHVSNCWEQDDWVVMVGCRSTNPIPDARPEDGDLASMLAYMRLEANNYQWRFNLRTGEVREGDIDTLNTEFNKSNNLFAGIKSRFAYHQRIPLLDEGGTTLRFTALVKYDNDTGQRQMWEYGDGVFGNEVAYAPCRGATALDAEDDGYLINTVTDSATWESNALVFSAADISRGPIATIPLPQRLPFGFHCAWMPGEQIFV